MHHRLFSRAVTAILLTAATWAYAASNAWKDLSPVRAKPCARHFPLRLAVDGRSSFSLCVMSPDFKDAAEELQDCMAEATGASLPLVEAKVILPAIVLGDCPEARFAGLGSEALPPEGFELKTAREAVFR